VSYSVFVSHCMAEEDAPLVDALFGRLRSRGIEPYLAERDLQPGRMLASKVLERIRSSDVVAVLWTKRGADSHYVNQEVGASRAVGRPVVPIVERGVKVDGLLEGVERVEFDRDDPDSALESLERFLAEKLDAKAAAQDAAEAARLDAEFWRDIGTIAVVTTVVAVFVIVLLLAQRS
jgi:hypothetical protein